MIATILPVLILPVIILPHFDPIAVAIGPIAIHWYALAYIGGIIFAWWRGKKLLLNSKNSPWLSPAASAKKAGSKTATSVLDAKTFEDFVLWATLGVVLGGRLGYVLFYQPGFYLTHPLEALKIWQGGMSFHGGLMGVVLAIYGFCQSRGIKFAYLSDILAQLVPVGLGLGRIANFINNELWGRPSDLPWAMIFPDSDNLIGDATPRHPSQLYEAFFEGMILFIILWFVERAGWRKKPGLITGLFLFFYGVFRGFCEFFREPDSFMGYPLGGFTMGQILSVPLIFAGLIIIINIKNKETSNFG
ncbi:MAG: prolipoprotein diacylglyceryl transferase [Alphaproteobacteria bacterium]|nr:prolipoprotein diacylglyceryl transferase [Alphaproteobacteria bacterium]